MPSSDFMEDLLLLAARRVFLDHHEDGTLHKRLYPGDVLAVSRWGNLYEHYGVYIGGGRVIHFAAADDDFGEAQEIREASLAVFEKDSDYRIVAFPKTSPMKGYHLYSARETVARAKSCLGEAGYELLGNNCEHFALWCKTGVKTSRQANALWRALLGGCC